MLKINLKKKSCQFACNFVLPQEVLRNMAQLFKDVCFIEDASTCELIDCIAISQETTTNDVC